MMAYLPVYWNPMMFRRLLFVFFFWLNRGVLESGVARFVIILLNTTRNLLMLTMLPCSGLSEIKTGTQEAKTNSALFILSEINVICTISLKFPSLSLHNALVYTTQVNSAFRDIK